MFQYSAPSAVLQVETAPSLFAPRGPDAGTLAMLACACFTAEDKVLDLGCGYGLVGLVAAQTVRPENLFLLDHDPLAVRLAERNLLANGGAGATVALSDGFQNFTEKGFTKILSHPPYHSDFSVAKHFIEKGFNRLVVGGVMFMVTKREVWYREKFCAIFGGVRIKFLDGYFVFEAEKRQQDYARANGGRRAAATRASPETGRPSQLRSRPKRGQ